MRRLLRTLPLILLFVYLTECSSAPRVAPFDGTFFIEGTVTTNGTPMPGVFVVLTFDPRHAVPEVGETDATGKFRLGSILGSDNTSYTVTFAKEGFTTISRQATYPATKVIDVEMIFVAGVSR